MGVGVTRNLHERLDNAYLTDGIDAASDRASEMWLRIGQLFPVTTATAVEGDDATRLAVYIRYCTQPVRGEERAAGPIATGRGRADHGVA
jgi:hypothetical protein